MAKIKNTNCIKARYTKSQKTKFILCLLKFVILNFFNIILFAVVDIPFAIFFILFWTILFAYLFELYLINNNYKLKYFFLGKTYKLQCKNLDDLRKYDAGIYYNLTDNIAKLNYRRYGDIFKFVEKHKLSTPFIIFREDNQSFNYYNSLAKQKLEYIIFLLYNNIVWGYGLSGFFEMLVKEPFTYQEFISLVKNSNFSGNLKDLLTNPDYQSVYIANFLANENADVIKKFEQTESNKINDFEDEIYKFVEDIAVQKFKEINKTKDVPQECVALYLSKDGNKRFYIIYDKNIKAYKVFKQIFQFDDYDNYTILHQPAYWEHCADNYGWYASEELILKDLQEELKDYFKFDKKL